MIGMFNKFPERSVFIPGNVPSSKNSKQWTGTKLIWSKPAREYREATQWLWASEAQRFKEMIDPDCKPLIIGFYFVRDTNRIFDFVNPLQTVQDMMVSYGWIPDDNIKEMLPCPVYIDGKYYSVDKEKPGVYIIPL
jgi:hypothetical protein